MHQAFVRAAFGSLLVLGVGAVPAAETAAAAPPSPAPIQVMVVGTFHFDNPGLDYRNVKVDDVLVPARQKEIDAIVNALAAFRPTLVGVEWRDDAAKDAFSKYRSGVLPPSRDESVQIGFRLARRVGLASVRGMDSPMGLPFDPVVAYAKDHGRQDIIDEITNVSDANVAIQQSTLRKDGIAATLRILNNPSNAMATHGLYRDILKLGNGADQPGVDMVTAWYKRNLAICANLLQAARPGDKVVIFFGAGHLPLLRQCIEETPGYRWVDALAFLPSGQS